MKKLIYILLAVFAITALSACEEGLEKPIDIDAYSEKDLENLDLPDEVHEKIEEMLNDTQPEPEISPEPSEPEPELEPEPEPVSETPQPPSTPLISLPDIIIDPTGEYGSPLDAAGNLSNERMSWYFNRNKEHQPPAAQKVFDIRLFDGYYLGDINDKVVYLTFDEGYENGFTAPILDVLKEKDVKAAFFVTKTYIDANPELIQRMVDEGHIVGNHSVTHPSMPSISDADIIYEIEETARTYTELTGLTMPLYFRPPSGEYSARTLALTQSAGYKTIFWSFAYKDWEVDNQPGREAAYQTVMNDLHNGMLLLLHAVSESNTQALPDIIDAIRANGYTFKTLDDLPN